MYKIHHKWNHDFPKLARASGFKFFNVDTNNCQPLDFRKIGQLDMDAIKSESNFEQLAQLIPHVAEAPIATLMNSHILDPALVKYFMAAQLIAQYLTFCLQCLDQAVSELHQTICELETDKQATAAVVRRQNDELNHLQRKVSRLQAGHRRKRVADEAEGDASAKDLNLINTIKLELEVKHLKERLNNAEKELHDRRTDTLQPTPIVVATPVPSPRRFSCSCSCRNNDQPTKSVQDVGIQSNLDEAKEADDKTVDLLEMMERMCEAQSELAQKWKPLNDQRLQNQPGGREVELFTQKFEHLESLVTNLSQNLETMRSRPDSGEEKAVNQLIRTKISEIERSQELGQQKLQELDSAYGEKLGDIRTELGKLAQFLADEKKPPPMVRQTEMKAVQAMVHSVPSEDVGE
jgi:zinc finger protein DZIP1